VSKPPFRGFGGKKKNVGLGGKIEENRG